MGVVSGGCAIMAVVLAANIDRVRNAGTYIFPSPIRTATNTRNPLEVDGCSWLQLELNSPIHMMVTGIYYRVNEIACNQRSQVRVG